MIVLVASAVLELLLVTERGERVAQRIRAPKRRSPLDRSRGRTGPVRRYVMRRQLDESRATAALVDLRDLDMNRYPHDLLLVCIWELRHNVSAYGAAYLAVAEALGAPLLTSDARLRDLPRPRIRMELLS